MLYSVNSPHNPATFWTMNMKSQTTQMFYDPYPELEEYKLAEYEAVRWKSTDGKENVSGTQSQRRAHRASHIPAFRTWTKGIETQALQEEQGIPVA